VLPVTPWDKCGANLFLFFN